MRTVQRSGRPLPTKSNTQMHHRGNSAKSRIAGLANLPANQKRYIARKRMFVFKRKAANAATTTSKSSGFMASLFIPDHSTHAFYDTLECVLRGHPALCF